MPPNSRPFPRYDASKFGRFRAFSAKCIGNRAKIVRKILTGVLIHEPLGGLVYQKMGYICAYRWYAGNWTGFFRFFNFSAFYGHFCTEIFPFLDFDPKLDLKMAIECQKIENLKKACLFSSLHTTNVSICNPFLLNEQIPMDVAQYTRGEFLSYLIVWRLTC